MDAVTLLRNDHKTVEGLFKRFEKAGPNAHKTKQDLVGKIVEELSIHAAIEEQVLYPAARQAVPDENELVLESLEEHHIVKWVLSEVDGMDPADERFTAKVTVLIENVRHHVDEEEGELFPALRSTMKRKDLQELAQAIEQAKKMAPTHPHPRAPDTPPGNLVAGAAAGAIDKAEDTGKKTVRKILGRTRSRKAS
jgi:hemerythrin superfamily protein